MSPLAQRVAAAVVLVPVVVAAVLLLPTVFFALAFLVFVVVGAREWPTIAGLDGRAALVFQTGTAVGLAVAALAVESRLAMLVLFALALGYWALATVWVVQVQHGHPPNGLEHAGVRIAAGWATLVPAWIALVVLHAIAPALVLFVLVLIWVADSAAFFVGRRFGTRRLASRVSPGKSWEGVAGGLVAVVAFAAIAESSGAVAVSNGVLFVLLGLAVAVLSVLGDLAESLFKRRAGVKDSGTLIPGHGGVLDRIDSITAAAPAFAFGWLLAGLEVQ